MSPPQCHSELVQVLQILADDSARRLLVHIGSGGGGLIVDSGATPEMVRQLLGQGLIEQAGASFRLGRRVRVVDGDGHVVLSVLCDNGDRVEIQQDRVE